MGMYTQLNLNIDLKESTPTDVIELIKVMAIAVDGKTPKFLPESVKNNPLFKDEDNFYWILKAGGSYYFDGAKYTHFTQDSISKQWSLSFCRDIKNYDKEWENLLDFLAPHIDTEGFIGTYRYEEAEIPTNLYHYEGKIYWITQDASSLPSELRQKM